VTTRYRCGRSHCMGSLPMSKSKIAGLRWLLQEQIHWIEVNKSTFLYQINVSNAAEQHLYGVAVKQSGDQNHPIYWASCLYDDSERAYFNDMCDCDFVLSHVVFI